MRGWAKLLRVGPGEGKWAEGRGFGACGRNRERRAGTSGQKQWGSFPFSFLLFSFWFLFLKAYFKTNFENHLKISLNHFVFWDQITQYNKINSLA